ncbi:DUF4097 family beta strand repeat-containing protein [Anaerocolumna xylanovorans]|uniref:Putative adhesin n=1 Tax=Anaerocolumna xylanovorans DSM 12503 TaxID=1121345 RepID=A0A1M7Y5L3_9FIRM|nr:DUF4097 family beta strand repeat-containing protein [Anaerocolumna xylanovorans]SHO47806.1 Putative adhesin [Anaerocolumna xylanovorans DSM 12503]
MSEFQRIIKYAAMAFAIFLTVAIITGIVGGVLALTGAISAVSDKKNKTESTAGSDSVDFDKEFEGIVNLHIMNGVGELTIEKGSSDKVRVEASDVTKDFRATVVSGDELKISTKSDFWNIFSWGINVHRKPRITVYLPEGFEGRNVVIDAGAGNIKLEDLICEKLDINAGVGNINGNNIKTSTLNVDGGVGEITLDEVTADDSDINAGVGNIHIQGTLNGKNTVDAGVGDIRLILKGSADDYNIKVDPGVGSVYVDGNKYGKMSWNNKTAENSIDIDGGVGSIHIDFKNN